MLVSMLRWGAVIVAGGRSSRMGRPKAFLAWRGEPLLRHVVRTALEQCPTVVVAASPGQPLPWLPAPARRIDDPAERAHRGPVTGVLTGLQALAASECDAAFLTSSDAVESTATHIGFIQARLEDASPGTEAVVPCSEQDGRRIVHGLSSAVRIEAALRALHEMVTGDRWALKELFENLPTRWLDVDQLPDPAALQAPNTPEAWEAHRRRHRG